MSTEYYQNNRVTKTIQYKCAQCDYITYNSRLVLVNHINAKHTEEKDRPYQCTEKGCARGFSQKAHLINHLKKIHSKDTEKYKNQKHILIYNIDKTDVVPRSKNTIARMKFYESNKNISSEEIHNNKYIYGDNKILSTINIRYDATKGYITVTVDSIKHDRRENIGGRYGY